MEAVEEQIRASIKSNEKCIVFSHFIFFIQLLQTRLDASNIKFEVFDGSVDSMKRSQIIKRFKKDELTFVLIMSIRTGGVGMNLTSASRVFLVEPWWNPSFEAQAISRVHRIGQTKDVTVIRFVVEDTIE